MTDRDVFLQWSDCQSGPRAPGEIPCVSAGVRTYLTIRVYVNFLPSGGLHS